MFTTFVHQQYKTSNTLRGLTLFYLRFSRLICSIQSADFLYLLITYSFNAFQIAMFESNREKLYVGYLFIIMPLQMLIRFSSVL